MSINNLPFENRAIEKNTILLIDDEPVCHSLLQLIIKSSTNYNLLCAYGSSEAILLAEKYGKDIIIVLCDLMLNGENGFDVYDLFQNNAELSSIPFLFQTGLGTNRRQLALSDDVEIIFKPFTSEDLLMKIQQIVSRK